VSPVKVPSGGAIRMGMVGAVVSPVVGVVVRIVALVVAVKLIGSVPASAAGAEIR